MAYGYTTTSKTVTTLLADNADRSYSFWTYRVDAGGGSLGRVFSQAGSQSFWNQSTNYKFNVTFSTTSGRWSFTSPTLNEWHHILVVYNNSDVANVPVIYVDGISVSVNTDIIPVGTAAVSTSELVIGNVDANNRNWGGNLCEFAVYDALLTQDDATALAALYSAYEISAEYLASYLPLFDSDEDYILANATSTAVTVETHVAIIPIGGIGIGGDELKRLLLGNGVMRGISRGLNRGYL